MAAMGFGGVVAASVVAAPDSAASVSVATSSCAAGIVVSDPSDTKRTWTTCPFDWVTIAVGISAPGLRGCGDRWLTRTQFAT